MTMTPQERREKAIEAVANASSWSKDGIQAWMEEADKEYGNSPAGKLAILAVDFAERAIRAEELLRETVALLEQSEIDDADKPHGYCCDRLDAISRFQAYLNGGAK